MNNILITGASGFLGKEVTEVLKKKLENNIWTLGKTQTTYHHIFSDLLAENISLPNVAFNQVIHLAGKAHTYPKTPEEAQEFEDINYYGTINLLNALVNQTEIKSFMFASTVAVYGVESGENISEDFVLQTSTPYGKSKRAAEIAIMEFCEKKNINFLILRLPLIAGENPPGNLGKMKKAISNGYYVRIKGNTVKKSVVLANDVAHLISDNKFKSGIYNLTDGRNPTFSEIESALEKSQKRRIIFNVPLSVLNKVAIAGDFLLKFKINAPLNSAKLKKITSSLTFNDDKAVKELNWKPNSVIDFLTKTEC